MRLYYTGNRQAGKPQATPTLSLGGYPSTSLVPSQGVNKIFGSISQKQLYNGGKSVRALVLKNETQAIVSGASIYYQINSQSPISSYRIGIVTLAPDSCGDDYMEIIESQSSPIDAVLINAKGSSNALSIPDIEAGDYVGIWIERSIDTIKSKKELDCDVLLERFENSDILNTVSDMTVTLSAVPSAGSYFTIDTVLNKYMIWFTDGNTEVPQLANTYELLPITIAGDTVGTVIDKIYNKITELIVYKEEVTIEKTSTSVTITNTSIGPTIQSQSQGGSIAIQTNQGVGSIDQQEDVDLIISY